MPRHSRQLSGTGIHHIMVRGVNRQRIFEDSTDHAYYLACLRAARDISQCTILAYCCMPNHVHLLVEEGGESISVFMKRLGVRYVRWYNLKYDRVGHLFQNRFVNRPVEDDPYFLTVLMYIHFNPVAAGLCDSPLDYRWSSRPTLGRPGSLVNLARLEQLVPLESLMEGETHYEPPKSDNDSVLGQGVGNSRMSNEHAWSLIAQWSGAHSSSEFQHLRRDVQEECVRAVRAYGLSVRQISMLTGLNRNLIQRWRPEPAND